MKLDTQMDNIINGAVGFFAGSLRTAANTASFTGLPVDVLHDAANAVDGTINGVEKSLVTAWANTGLQLAEKLGGYNFAKHAGTRTGSVILGETHQDMLDRAKRNMKDGMSRIDAQATVIQETNLYLGNAIPKKRGALGL